MRCFGRFLPKVVLIALALALSFTMRADELDGLINASLRDHHIPGLSLAIIDGGKIVKAQGYGFIDSTNSAPVTTNTLFQAASISKPLTALATLRLVAQGKLTLDGEVNHELKSWKIPDNHFTDEKQVTLRELLSHTAGLTIHGFGGYAVDQPLPSLIEILNGTKPPANNSRIRVFLTPGTAMQYSGGGYVVLQQLLGDVTGQPFADFMRTNVLAPSGMTNSSFAQPLPRDLANRAAHGQLTNGTAVTGNWHVYPEQAAAGLWTTASDLAQFVIGIQHSYRGETNAILTQTMVREMLTVEKNNYGLGVFISGSGNTLRFYHEGRNEGFDAYMVGFPNLGRGFVILINANDNSGAMRELVKSVAGSYRRNHQ